MLKIEIPVGLETHKCAAHVIERLSQVDATLCGPFLNYDEVQEGIVQGMLAEMEAISRVVVQPYLVYGVYVDSAGNPTAELTQGPNYIKLVLVP